jgi:hypothetical protein
MIIEGEDTTNTEDSTNGVSTGSNPGGEGESIQNGAGNADGNGSSGSGKTAPTSSAEEREAAEVNAFKQAAKGEVKEPDGATPKEKPGDASTQPGKGGKQPEAAKPTDGADPNRQGDPAKKQPDAELEKEITGLGLKGKSAERFREMAGEIKTTRPMMEVLGRVNVKDANQLDALLRDASVGLGYEKMIMDAGAQPEQLKGAMQIISAMNTGKPELQVQAAQMMIQEARVVLERHGVHIEGVTGDPLEKHPDLKQAVEAMDMTREHALELARLRTGTANRTASDQANERAAMQRQQEQQAETKARADIDILSESLKRNDPHFAHKFNVLAQTGQFEAIKRLPWSERYAAVLNAYNAIPNPVAQAPAPSPQTRVRPTAVTNRGNNVSSNGVARTEFKNDLEAFRYGVESATHRE